MTEAEKKVRSVWPDAHVERARRMESEDSPFWYCVMADGSAKSGWKFSEGWAWTDAASRLSAQPHHKEREEQGMNEQSQQKSRQDGEA